MKKINSISVVILLRSIEGNNSRTIASVYNQTYNETEIILVNLTGEKCDFLLKNTEDIITLNLSSDISEFEARKIAIETSTKDYIMFVNQGDIISVDTLRHLSNKKTNNDIIIVDNLFLKNGDIFYYNYDLLKIKNINLQGDEVKEWFLSKAPYYNYYWNFYNKLYRKSLLLNTINKLENINIIPELIDLYFSFYNFYFCNSLTNIHNVFYTHSNSIVKTYETIAGFFSNLTTKEYIEIEKMIVSIITLYSNDKCENLTDKFSHWCNLFKHTTQTHVNKSKENSNLKKLLNCYFGESLNYEEANYEYYIKYETIVDHDYYRIENLKKSLSKPEIEILSFDIFDTLVKRKVLDPHDLFRFLDIKYNKSEKNVNYIYFSKMRIEAENFSRKQLDVSIEEISLEEIYTTIHERFNINKKLCNQLMEYEKKLEIEFNVQRNAMKDIYELGLYLGKKIICISDMYLPKDTIADILEKNEYINIDKLYVSSEVKLTKETSNLFKHVKDDLNFLPNTAIHIGDNYHSDYLRAGKEGFISFHIPKISEMFFNSSVYKSTFFNNLYDNRDLFDSTEFLGNRCYLAHVANEIFDSPSCHTYNFKSDYNGNIYNIGYFPIASAVFSQLSYLINIIKEHKYKKVHFLSRDGHLLKESYDIMKNNLNIGVESNYLYCSRKMLFPLSIKTSLDFYSLFYSNKYFNITPLEFYDIFSCISNYSKEEFINSCEENNIDVNKILDKNMTEISNFLEYITKHFYSENKNGEYRKRMKKHFETIIGENEIIVDIGYSGRAECIFTNLLDYPVSSYYIHTNGKIGYDRAKNSNFNIHTFLYNRPKLSGIIREYIYMKPEGSCSKIIIKDDKPELIFEEFTSTILELDLINTMQNSVVESINVFMQTISNYFEDLEFKYQDLSFFLERYLHKPKIIDAYLFSIVPFDDSFAIENEKKVNLFIAWKNNLKSIYDDKNFLSDNKEINEIKTSNSHSLIKRIIIKPLKPIYDKVITKISYLIHLELNNTNNNIKELTNSVNQLKEEINNEKKDS